MNDRYLFKAKRKNWKELPKEEWWVVGYLYRLSEEHPPFIMLKSRYGESHEIDESTICACTGLKDKNGTLILENNIVSVTRENGMVEYAVIKYHTSSTMSGFKMSPLRDWIFTSFNEVEVIGNVFDNPELLEVE